MKDIKPRVPPDQYVTSKFPVLTYGATPRIALEEWRLHLTGLAARPVELTWEQFQALPRVRNVADFHCVTGWSRLNNEWEGVGFRELVNLVGPRPEARFVAVGCYGGYTTNMDLAALMDEDVLLACRHDGSDLPPEHGGPVRLVVPKRYAWKSAKWVHVLEFLAEDRPGFWETHGYHNVADPWREERYSG